MKRELTTLGFTAALMSTLSTGALFAQTFSVDFPSVGLSPDNIYGPGPGPPTLVFPGTMGGPPIVEVDAFSYHVGLPYPIDGINFSVSPGAAGAPASAVAGQAGGDEPADIYFAPFPGIGTNVLIMDGDGSIPPPLGLPEPAMSNLDGLDATVAPPPPATVVYFSVPPGALGTGAGGPYAGFSPADVFSAPAGAAPAYSFPGGGPAPVYAMASELGLMPGDDINGLHYIEEGVPGPSIGDKVYFTLAPGSPTLGALGAVEGDVLLVAPLPFPAGPPVPVIFATGVSLGLAVTDDMNALHMHMTGAGLPVELSEFSID